MDIPKEAQVPVPATTQLKIAAGRGVARNLFALSRYVRLFGLGHSRTTEQMESAFQHVRGLIPTVGLTLELTGDRLTVDGIPLEQGPAELAFARFLRQTRRMNLSLDETFTIEALEDIISAMAFDAPRDEATPKKMVVAPGEDPRDWLNDPSRLLYFINVALQETAAASASSLHPGPLTEVAAEEIAELLHVLGKFGTSQTEGAALGAARQLQRVGPALVYLVRELLAEYSEDHAHPAGDALLLKLGDDIVIRFVLTKLENERIAAAEIPGLLDRLGRQLNTLRTMMPSYEEKMARGGIALDSYLETLEQELWSAAPDAAKRMVLLFETPYYVPATCIVPYLERLIAHGEELVAGTILRNYGNAVDGRDAEGRRRSAKGVSDLAELYALVVPDYVPKLLKSVSRQLMRESDLRMQSLLSAALIRLSYTVQQQRDFVASAAASDALEEIVHRRPVLGMELRPRISVENRLPEYLDEALTANHITDDLVSLLQRYAAPVAQQLCNRFLNSSLREESSRLTNLAGRMGEETHQELLRRLQSGSSEDALGAVGLLSSVNPEEVAAILPARTREWTRVQQDTLVRQLSISASPKRGTVLLKLLPDLDALIIPGAIDEIGMSGDVDASHSLLDIAMAGESPRFSGYSKVKAIEALGRLRAEKALAALNELLQERKVLHWAQPHELRIAALQAMHMIDPERAAALTPQMGVSERELSIGPLAVDPSNPFARQRRYQRVFPMKPMTAVATSNAGKAGLDIMTLSLGGGKARRQGKMQPGSDVTLQLQLALRKLNSQILVREVMGNEITFEIADIGLSDRSRLRHLLLAQSPVAPQPQAAA
ncbi:hypothetical protein Acid345_0546 [Candidatus Koribacter versatilis Ellin345]|uniref:PilZ domain-containing protein n=1 Tax=Koribacter versatilis (strain Ellin345) TaxID=204669 RepID=Q1IU99_KORVE|nr:PilZ domain-containing protein [Candidatus Koribacter versatilis]ABF39551.1 hypothetical protein Acid345_0546 [Candidatus Koribacter versatilis Ellin345]